MNFKTTILLSLIGLCALSCTSAPADSLDEAGRAVKAFYTAYASDMLTSKAAARDSLLQQYLTKGLQEKVARVRNATDADAVLRAQDFTEEALQSLQVAPLNGRWYMVCYQLTSLGKTTRTEIPVRVAEDDKRYMLDYITPVWGGSAYGDTLLCDTTTMQPVNDSAPLTLLNTFYAAYTTLYCASPANLSLRLAALRSAYCTADALAQWQTAYDDYLQDGRSGYDLLIGDFDFDRIGQRTMSITKMPNGTFCVRYNKGGTPAVLTLTVAQQGKCWRICSIKNDLNQ